MNEFARIAHDAYKDIHEQILKISESSIKIDIPTLDLDKISGSKNFTFNPFK